MRLLAWAKAKLVKERDSLAQTSKKLARDLAKVTASCDLKKCLVHISCFFLYIYFFN